MAPKGKPAGKEKAAKGKPDAKAKDAKGKEDKKDEPKQPIYMNPKARTNIMIVATVMVIVALIIFYLYRKQWNRANQIIGAVDSLRGILAYHKKIYEAMSDIEILTEFPKFATYMQVMEKKNTFARTELKRVLKLLDQGWFVYDQHLFYLSKEQKGFDEANNECKKDQALLAYSENNEHWIHLFEIDKENKYWIGLDRDAHKANFKWVTGAVLGPNYTNWTKLYPPEKIRKCIMQYACPFNTSKRCWSNSLCHSNRRWICKMPPNAVMMSKDDGLLF